MRKSQRDQSRREALKQRKRGAYISRRKQRAARIRKDDAEGALYRLGLLLEAAPR